MPTPTKFTADRKKKIIEALTVGASRSTAAAIAGLGDESVLRRWITKGKEAAPGTSFAEFYEAVLEAEAHPRMRALGVIYNELPDRPDLAWKFIERREPGYAPPMPNIVPSQGPVVIELALSGGAPLALAAAEIVEGEIVAEEDPGADPSAEA